MFIDASIEGDLLHAAGVATTWGRESNDLYGETKNGIRATNTYRQFAVKVDPYVTPGQPESGLIATIQDEPLVPQAAGDLVRRQAAGDFVPRCRRRLRLAVNSAVAFGAPLPA